MPDNDHTTGLRRMHTAVSFGVEFVPPYDPNSTLFRPLIQMSCARYGTGLMTFGMRRNDGTWPLPLIMDEKWFCSSPPTEFEFWKKVTLFVEQLDQSYRKNQQRWHIEELAG